MDQLKDFLKQAVKYRFWIAFGVSLLLPMIAYFVGSGPVKAKAAEATKKIVDADKEVANYTSPGLPNHQYKPIVEEKTAVVTTDVNKAWDKLYARQAPLLKWPEEVESRFHSWGRKWPENVDRGAVQKAITDYVLVYDKAVTETYKKVNPWEPVEGTGIVVVPDEKSFLGPAVFDVANPPKLGKVWAAQERLWTQGTLLDAIASINKGAKSWDDAVVKQIEVLEVGSTTAQDQKSMADGEAVTKAESLDPEGEGEAAAESADGASGYEGMMGGKAGMAMMGMMGGGGGAQATEDVYYLDNPSTQFKIIPVKMIALVDQNRLQDFFIGLENSPMAIQVMEFDLVKPTTPVTKPVKGEALPGGMGMGRGMMGMMGMGRGMMGMMGDGESSSMGSYPGGMMGRGMPGGMSGGMMGRGMPGGMMGGEGEGYGMGMGMGNAGTAKSGTDNRSKDARKLREDKEKARKAMVRSNVDQYYDIVQVTVFGRARFYNPPPPPEPSSESESASSTETPTVTDPGAPPAASVTDPGAPAPAPKAEAPKDEAPKPATPPADAPKPEAPKADVPKAEPSKSEAPPKDAAPKG